MIFDVTFAEMIWWQSRGVFDTPYRRIRDPSVYGQDLQKAAGLIQDPRTLGAACFSLP